MCTMVCAARPIGCNWPIAEIVDAEINAHLSSAHKRTAEFSLVRVVLAAIDPLQTMDYF